MAFQYPSPVTIQIERKRGVGDVGRAVIVNENEKTKVKNGVVNENEAGRIWLFLLLVGIAHAQERRGHFGISLYKKEKVLGSPAWDRFINRQF